jgi:hypothetical protein
VIGSAITAALAGITSCLNIELPRIHLVHTLISGVLFASITMCFLTVSTTAFKPALLLWCHPQYRYLVERRQVVFWWASRRYAHAGFAKKQPKRD